MRTDGQSNYKMLKSMCKNLQKKDAKRIRRNVIIQAGPTENEQYLPGGIVPLRETETIKHYLYDGLTYLDSESAHSNK